MLFFDDNDRRVAHKKSDLRKQLLAREVPSKSNADVDFCEYRGKVFINYAWGDQEGIEFLAEAVYPGHMRDFLHGFFPAPHAR